MLSLLRCTLGPYFNPGAQGGGKLHAQGGGKLAEKCKKMYFPARTIEDLWPKMIHPKIFPRVPGLCLMTFLDVWRRVRAICDYISSLYAIRPDRTVSPPGPPAHYPQSPPAPQAAPQPPAGLFLPVLSFGCSFSFPSFSFPSFPLGAPLGVPALVNGAIINAVENGANAHANGLNALANGESAVENGEKTQLQLFCRKPSVVR